jgi:TolB-like protein/Flp pilus assembly protein TadD
MRALAAAGDRTAAIQQARIFEMLVQNELESQPDPDVAALAHELQSGASIVRQPATPRLEPGTVPSTPERVEPAPLSESPPPVASASPSVTAPRGRWRVRRPTAIALAAFAVLIVAAIFIVRLRAANAAPVINSIAVLPFDGYSSDPRQDYLAQSLTDAVITDLAVLPKLTVISRQSVLQFAGSKMPIPEIERSLGVDAVVEGTFLRDGQHIRLNAQLIYKDRHLWAKHYDRDVADLVSLEDELASEIAREIHRVAAGDELGIRRTLRPRDPIVQGQYAHGEFLLLSRTPASVRQAIELFQAAVARDSTFALGYAAIAEAFGLASDDGFLPQVMANDSAKIYVKRALDIDSLVGTAHAVRGGSLSEAGNFTEAEKEFKRAIELEPNNGLAHHWYAMLLATLHRGPEAIAENTRAEEIDPQAAPIRNAGGSIRNYFGAPHRPTGRERPPVLELDPTNAWSRSGIAVTKARQHRCDEAKAEIAKAAEDVPRNVRMTLISARVFTICGDRAHAVALFNEAKALPEAHRHGLYFALGFHTLNQPDSMFAWLDSTSWNVQQRFNFRTNPGLDSLKDDPRYKRVLQRMGLGT